MENNTKLAAKKVGDLLELKAVCWLLEQGYEVFRNDCSTGPIDIIALNLETNEILKIDVKTVQIRSDGKRACFPKLRDNQVNLGIKLLGFNEKTNTWILIDGKPESQQISF
tara:strand:+ start:114 stop:446 length:333 start_codon:yes stop_codon:yes gene_type:complete